MGGILTHNPVINRLEAQLVSTEVTACKQQSNVDSGPQCHCLMTCADPGLTLAQI